MTRARPVLVACSLVAITARVFAQAPNVELRLDTNVLELGEAVQVELVCTNTPRPDTPAAVVPDGLELKLLNPVPSTSQITQIVNGSVSQQTTYTFLLQLTALKEGTFTLGPVRVDASGEPYETKPVRIVVRKTDHTSVPKGDRFVFVELSVEPTALYVTETYTATLTFGIRKVEIRGRVYDVDMLRDVLDGSSSQLSIFADGRARRSERWLRDSHGVRHLYEVFRVRKQIRAETVGETRVGPVFLKLRYPTGIRRGFFGGYSVTQARRETARADGITVSVKAPPEEGQPPDYTGAIGQYGMTVSAKPTRVEQGQPITLTVSIEGNTLEGVAGPDLVRHAELASRFDYTHDEWVGDIEQGAKVFRRAIFPKQAGEQTIPSITWSYFDPQEERYVTLASDPIPITVDPPRAASTPLARPDEPKPESNHTTLTVLTGGLSPNYADPDEVLADQAFTLTGPWVAAVVLSPLAWIVVALTTRWRARLKTDPGLARRRRAKTVAFARMHRALRHAQPGGALHGLAEAFTGYLADRFGLGSGTLTPGEVRSLLSASGVDQATATEIVDFLEQCDAAHYAPGAGSVSAAGSAPRTFQERPSLVGVGPHSGPYAPGSVPEIARAAGQVRRWIKRVERSKR